MRYMGQVAEAEAEYREALAIQQKLVNDSPADRDFRGGLAQTHAILGILLHETGKPTEAESEFRLALPTYEKLVDDIPDFTFTRYRCELASTQLRLGRLLSEAGKLAEAEAVYRQSMAIYQKAVDEDKATWVRDEAAQVDTDLSVVLRHLGQPAEARAACERAIAIRETLVQDDRGRANYSSPSGGKLPPSRPGPSRYGRRRRCLGRLPTGAGLVRFPAVAKREHWFLTACSHAALAGLGGQDGSGVPRDQRRARPMRQWHCCIKPPAWAIATPPRSERRTPSTRCATARTSRS